MKVVLDSGRDCCVLDEMSAFRFRKGLLYYGIDLYPNAILIIIEGQFQILQRFSSSKLILKSVKSRFAALNYYENGL